MKFNSRPLDFTQRILVDLLQTSRPPDAHAIMLLDMTEVHAFRARYLEEHGVSLTDLHVIIKALARTIRPNSQLNSVFSGRGGYRVLEPDSTDFGVSIATGRSVTPVVVLERTNEKTLRQIHDELKEQARFVVDAEMDARENGPPKWHNYAKFAPAVMRRGAIKALVSSPKVRRSKVGTIQITSLQLDDLEFYLPTHLGTATLISVGGTKLRPMIVDGKVEARQSVYMAWHIDQRVVSAVRAGRVFRRFKLLIASPDKLLED